VPALGERLGRVDGSPAAGLDGRFSGVLAALRRSPGFGGKIKLAVMGQARHTRRTFLKNLGLEAHGYAIYSRF
jgi:hypothetical protein